MQINKLALLSGLVLTACVQLEHNANLKTIPPTPEPASEPVQSGGCDGLEYYQRLSGMTPDEIKWELSALRLSQQKQDDSCPQLKLSMLLSQPDNDYRNNVEAERLLGEFLGNGVHERDQDRALASLLREIVQERLRAQETQKNLERELKQALIASAVLKKRLLALKSQLEQLKSLEQDINKQEQAISTPSRNKATDEK